MLLCLASVFNTPLFLTILVSPVSREAKRKPGKVNIPVVKVKGHILMPTINEFCTHQ